MWHVCANCERYNSQGLKWMGMHGKAVPRPAIAEIWRSQASKSAFVRGNACFQAGNVVLSTGTQVFQRASQYEFGHASRGGMARDEYVCVIFNVQPRAGSEVVRIDPLHFLAGCRKKRLNQALSVLSLSLGFL